MPPAFLAEDLRKRADAIAAVGYCNPFLPRRIDLERQTVGTDFIADGADWNVHGEKMDDHPNLVRLTEIAGDLVRTLAQRLRAGSRPSAPDLRVYEDVAIVYLYHRYRRELADLAGRAESASRIKAPVYERFARDAAELLDIPGVTLGARAELPHLFACFFQVRRAFMNIFQHLIGASRPAAHFRAAVWESIFTRDMRRYRHVLWEKMGDFATLITGPTGAGKELAARAIGLSRYVPFDERTTAFRADFATSFFPLNLSALSPTLIESELFGHKRGSFTGATADRAGWLELCPAVGTVFLDEIGELDPAIQVKLLRVLQERTFQRIGDSTDHSFRGKLIAATNRDLAAERRARRFRDDLYYRICSDMIDAPSLRDQIDDAPGELPRLITFLAARIVGDEAPSVAADVQRAIAQGVGDRYPWPGNVRELEQCVRNVIVRGRYVPPEPAPGATDPAESLAEEVRGARVTMPQLNRRYCALVYAREGTYEGAARRLGLDRRTVKAWVTGEPSD